MITTYAGHRFYSGFSGDGSSAVAAQMGTPYALAIDHSGKLFIADTSNYDIRMVVHSALTTGISNVVTTLAAHIYPNPNSGRFSLMLHSPISEQAEIAVTNILGQKVKSLTITTNLNETVELDVPAGIYYLNATTSAEKLCSRVVIQ